MDRVSYDRFWGALLALTCLFPRAADRPSSLWTLLGEAHGAVFAWLIVGSAAGVVALALGIGGFRGRWRHFINFALGVVTLALPGFAPEIWQRFEYANPARLPLSGVDLGWVMLAGLGALYAGAGIRVARPSLALGQTLGGLGAFLLAVFAFLPPESTGRAYAFEKILLFKDFRAHWRVLVPFSLVATSVSLGTLNLLRTPLEVLFAKLTRFLLVAGLLFWIARPFLESGAKLAQHQPVAWGALRFLAPLFLAVDGCVAFVAISFTRGAD